MTDDAAADEFAQDSNAGAEEIDGIELTPEQTENLRKAFAGFQQSLVANIALPTISVPKSMIKALTETAGIADAQQKMLANALQPILATFAKMQRDLASLVNPDAIKGIAAAQANFGRITEKLTQRIDFTGIARISQSFANQQRELFKNLGPAFEAMRASFYPPNLRAISGLKFASVNQVVMADGISLYGLPRRSTAEALINAEGMRDRREILGRRWKTISADCRQSVQGCTSDSVAPYVPFAVAALDALDAGHSAAAQALAGSLIDAVVTSYFGKDRYKYTPSKRTRTHDAYDEFTIREFIAFAPMWQAYQQFFVSDGDKVPQTFSRNATAHTVSPRQFSRRNAIQGLMLACSLLYRLNEEAQPPT